MFDCDKVMLRSGAVLRAGAVAADSIWVTLDRQRISLGYPSAGLGGGTLLVSPDERYAVLYVLSGQSEQGYEVFALEPELRHLGGIPYRNGEGDAPKFTSDGRWLVMLATTHPVVHGTQTSAEEVLDPDADGELVVDWAELLVQPIPYGAPRIVPIATAIPASFDPDAFEDWTLWDAWELRADRAVLRLPWGPEVEVPLPPAGPVTTPPWTD
jgi:hypothetical protein